MIKQKEQISDTRKEFNFMSSSIISQVSRGILVGIFAGVVVGAFRFLIEKSFHLIQAAYVRGRSEWFWLVALLFFYAFIVFINARLVATEKDIKGSGIPQVEAELKGLMSLSWWSILWKKFLVGILAISSGLMLGREGPSIQLGAMSGKGISKWLNLSPVEERTLIASGAAAGLAAAFNAPIAGLLFVVEEVYHHFSRFFWVSTLAATLVADFILPSIYCAFSGSKAILRTTVPCLATILLPLTFKSLISTTLSPAESIAPLLSLWMTLSPSSKWSLSAWAKANSSSVRYSILSKSNDQPSALRRLSIRQAITFTGRCSLHILSLRQRQ